MTDPSAPKNTRRGGADHSEGMSYLESIPRQLVTLYLPLSIFLIVLLFPFYWMALTAIKPNAQLLDMETVSPFWTWSPTFQHIHKLLFELGLSVVALEHDVRCDGGDDAVDRCQRARGLRDRAPALQGRANAWRADLPRLSRAAVDPVHPALDRHLQLRAVRTRRWR